MIRYAVTKKELHSRIARLDTRWFTRAVSALVELPAAPVSSDFKPLWNRIKNVYIDLQCSKCCFCEKPLESRIEIDVEHFRPKVEVKPWQVPPHLLSQGAMVQQSADGSSEDGYSRLAYEPFNYAVACKTCNSTLKRNLFPIQGARNCSGDDPARMDGEQAFFVYPIGTIDTDPEKLIEFDALSPVPTKNRGYERHRALVTIEVFRLDDCVKRRSLFKERAYLLRLLYLELEGERTATSASETLVHKTVIGNLTSPESPYTNCMRSFERLYRSDRARAAQTANECLKFMNTKSGPPNK
jgi:hypothetical protein